MSIYFIAIWISIYVWMDVGLRGFGVVLMESFFNDLIDDHSFPTFKFCHFIWKGLVPTRLLASSKLNTREMFHRRQPYLHLSPNGVFIVGEQPLDQIFLHCLFGWSIWNWMLGKYGIVWVIWNRILDLFNGDLYLLPLGHCGYREIIESLRM